MNKDYYPAGAYNDPNAPYNQEDPRDSQDWEDMLRVAKDIHELNSHIQMWDDNIMDINGTFIESFSEQSDKELKHLAQLIRDNETGTHTTSIGHIVTRWVIDYCKPKDDDVDEALGGRDE